MTVLSSQFEDAVAPAKAALASAKTAPQRLTRDATLVIFTWVGTRLLLLITAAAVASATGRPLLDLLSNWDVQHFIAVAHNGYAVKNDMAFFPGLPLVLRAGMLVGLNPVVWGTIVAMVTSALATWALYRIGGAWAAVAWLFAPTSVFTLVPYSESPFCAAAFWAWERATKGRWWAASGLAAVACTLRVSGLFLVGALAVLALVKAWNARDNRDERAQALAGLVPLAIPLGVLGAYASYLYTLTGNWTAWFSAQAAGWMRGFTWPWDCLAHHWAAIQPGMYADHPGWVWIFRAELVSVIVGIIVVVAALRRRRVAEASWVAVQVLAFSLSYWFQSVCRAVLLWFPLWRMVGEAVERRRAPRWRAVWVGVGLISLASQVTWAVLFYLGMWAS